MQQPTTATTQEENIKQTKETPPVHLHVGHALPLLANHKDDQKD